MTGWTLTGVIATRIFSYALNSPYLERVSVLFDGGTVAVGASVDRSRASFSTGTSREYNS